ncbi:MAG: hypothetical protein H7X91_07605 [Burkholderiales bacterium]|nr:hypothetical protein [Burkholderiales bacterium]
MRSESPPDAYGVVTINLDVGAKSTLKGRQQRFRPGRPDRIDTLPADWSALLKRWLKRGDRCRWETLLREAGPQQVETARALLDWLVNAGWATIIETRDRTRWWPVWSEIRDPASLRAALGLRDPAVERLQLADALREAPQHADLAAAVDALSDLQPRSALARLDLLHALARWDDERDPDAHTTRRDFAQFARGDTKGVTTAEWEWLEAHVDLAAFGIAEHAPLLLLAAPLSLALPNGDLDLGAASNFIGLPPAVVLAVTAAVGAIPNWRIVENRTSFERVARQYGRSDGVIWLPGFAPGWWREAVSRLIALAPARGLIACDPDPAGIEICQSVGEIWESAGLPWAPWRMTERDLSLLAQRRALTDYDWECLQRLKGVQLEPHLHALAEALERSGQKGEQEGFL